MVIGVPREIKPQEYRVALTPAGTRELTADDHRVLIEPDAGSGSGFSDRDYEQAGAELVDRKMLFDLAELIVKVKEPVQSEFGLLKPDQTLFTYLHLAPNRQLLEVLLDQNIAAFGYETLEEDGELPLLAPMSEIAGRMAPLVAAHYLQRTYGGSGVLPAGTVGMPAAEIAILGAGVVGSNAARVAHALGMSVTVLNRSVRRLRHLDEIYGGQVNTRPLTQSDIESVVSHADILVGAVLVPGGRPPMLVRHEFLRWMKPGSVIVDVAVDQGGCTESTHPTTHDDPVYTVDGILHYAVSNMPGAYPRTSTLALTTSTLPYIRRLASLGPKRASKEDPALRTALNTLDGHVAHPGLAASVGIRPERPTHE